MKAVPIGKIITVSIIRQYLAQQNEFDFTEPITVGIFVSIAAWASSQRTVNKTPFWRTLKVNGELHPKFPGGIDYQKKQLEKEGHTIQCRGRKNFRYHVEN